MPVSSFPASARRSYPWLPLLIVGMTIVAFVIGVVMLRSIEVRMVEAMGENLTLASAEIADKLDRLLFERHGDIRILARAFSGRPYDKKYLEAAVSAKQGAVTSNPKLADSLAWLE